VSEASRSCSEDQRLATAGPRDVTFYTRPGCHLCDEAKAVIAPLLAQFGAALREVNIDEDPVLQERYGWDIPVIFIGAHKALKHRVDVAQFRKQLRDAGSPCLVAAAVGMRTDGLIGHVPLAAFDAIVDGDLDHRAERLVV
jgi:glutaredoxin